MSWFDRAVARAGIDLKPREEEPVQANDNSLVQGLLGKLGELGKGWGSNVEDVYNNSPMYADFRGVGEAWDKTDFKDPAGYYDNNTYAGSFGNAAIGNAAGVVGGVADLLGMEKLGNKMNDIVQGTYDPNEVEAGFNLDYITSPHGLARSTGNVIGSMATIAPFTALVPEAAASTAATKLLQMAGRLGGNKGIQYLIDSGHPQLAKVFAERLGSYLPSGIAWGATSAPIESMAEGGGVVRQAKEAGLDNPYGRGWATAAENLPGLFLSNVGEGMVLRGAFKPAPGASALRRAASVPVTAGVESTQNAGEEAYQQIIQNLNTDRPLSEGVSNAALEGFFGSLLLGGAGGALHAVRNKPGETDTQEFKDWTAGAPAGQDYSNIPMPTQGADIDEQVANLKDGWSDVIPQIGGILKNKFGMDGVISSGARSAEHNAEVGGAENSYHIQRADGGDALDIVLPDGTTQEQADAIEQYFKDSGMFEEVLFHDAGSGYHLHLGGLKGGKLPGAFSGANGRMSKEDFFNAVAGQESGGNYDAQNGRTGAFGKYQIMPENWASWAEQAGLPADADMTPENQEIVAKHKLGEYFDKYGAEGALVAWYAGEANAQRWVDGAEDAIGEGGHYSWDARQGNGNEPSIREYVQQTLGRMGATPGSANSSNSTQQETTKIDTYDDVYEQFAREQSQTSDEETKDFFSGMFTQNGKFIDNEENRRQIDERYGEELKEFADVYRNPSVQTQIDRLIDKAAKEQDSTTWGKLQAARKSGDIQLMQKYLDEAKAKEAPQIQGQTVPQVITQQAPAQNVPQAKPAFPIVQEPAQNAPQPAQQTEQAQPIQVPTQTIETPQNEPVQDTTEADNSTLRNLQTEIEDIKQKYSNGEITPVQAYSALKSQEDIFSRYNDPMGNKAMGMIAQAKNDFRTGNVPSPQAGGNVNGNTQSTQSTQAQPTESINTANQNQNAEPGQAEAEEVNQPVQQEAPQANGFVNNTVTTKKDKQFPGVTWDGRVEKDEWARRREIAKQHNGWWDGKSKSFGFRTEQDRENFLQAVNAPIEGTSTTTSQPVQQAEQEKPKKKSKALSQFKKNVAKVVSDYRKDKTTYEEAFQKVISMQNDAERVAPDQATKDEIQDVARDALMELESIYNEKNGHEFSETPSQTAQESAGEQETTTQVEEPTQEEKPAQSEAEPASNEGGEKSAQNATVEENSTVANKPALHFSDLEKAMKSSGRDVLIKALEQDYKPVGRNTIEAPDGTKYVITNKAYKTFEKDYQNKQSKAEPKQTEQEKPAETKQESSGAYTKVIPPKKKNDSFRVEVDVAKLKEYDNSRFNVRMIAKKHEALTNGKLAKDTYTFKFDTLEAAKAYADEVEAYITKYLSKDAEPKQEKPAETENNTVKEYSFDITPMDSMNGHRKLYIAKMGYHEYQSLSQQTKELISKHKGKFIDSRGGVVFGEEDNRNAYIDEMNALRMYKYYLNADILNGGKTDAFKNGYVKADVDEGKYGAIYYDHPLTEQEIADYELTPAEEESSNEQQAESGSPDGGHEGVRTRESGADKREEAGGVSEHDGRKGKGHGSDNVEEHSEEPQPAGVRAGAELDSAAGTGTDKRGNQPDVPLTEAQAHPSPTETPGHNYEIKENEGDPNKRNADVRYKQNIDAIKLLRQLEDEERMATPAEQKILAQFNGWGGLKSKFKEGSETDKELRSLLSAEEYRDAQRSSLSAYYTPPKIVKAIWAGLSHLGFKGGRILDPAMGVGNFFGCMPRDIMAKSVLDGVEMESLAARLARQLYPGADVQNTAFQRSNTPKNFYDLVITNVPFEQTIVNGYQVHNYYFAEGIDKVRPGGMMVYITGQGSLASGSDAARMRTYLNKEADLIGAFKLPSGVFDATNVGTDVVVFQKRTDGKKSPHGQDFTEVEQRGTYGNFYGVNEYFTQHKGNVLGEMSVGKNRFGDTELNVKSKGTVEDVADELEAAMKKLPKNVYEPVSRNNSKPFNPSETAKRAKADEKTRDREYYYKDGKIVQNQDGKETEIKGKQAEVVESYVKLKNSLNALLAAETDPKATDKQVESLRDMLNRDYNDFVKKHGYLHGANKRHFDDDPSSGMVQSLETPIETEEKTKSGATKKKVTGAKKASIFSERSTNPKKEVTHVDTASDALVASLNNTGGLDLEYMAKLTGKTQEKLLSELKGTVFKDPATESFVTKDEYLSGNVREKLILAKEMAKRDKSYAANIKALEEVQPEELVPEEIFVSLGTPWIPAQDVNNFVHTIANGKFTVHYNSALAKWTVTGWLNSTKFGTQHIDFDDFLTKVLNGQVIEIKYTDEDKKTHVDEAATKAVTAEAERLQAAFKDWIWKDKERAKRLTDYYNANFNNYVLREYDGSHLDPHEHGMNAKITLKPHQKDAVWRILQSGNTLLAHCVGAGKTFEMQTAGMEMRRLGMANKPMYLVPLNVVDQFAKDFRKLYPGAKLLVLTNDDLPQVKLTKKVTKTADGRIEITDLTKDMSAKEKERIAKNKAKRARTLARIRTEDWDGIIMSHTLFKELPVSPETQAAYMEEEFKRLEAALKEAKQTDSLDGKAERTLEEQKAKLQEKMEEARSVDVKDLGITFEQLGIDQLFVDEADLFKNLHFTSSKTSGNTKIKGITNPQANYKHRAFDMFLKTQWLSKMLNGRGVVFATGTPISNSMAELYTMMRYLDPQGLKEHGTELFDSWIGVFGDIGQDTQLNSTGTNWETVTKVRSYNNRPELLKMFRKFADIKQPSDLPDIQRPNLKGGKPTIIELPVDPTVSRYLKERVPKRIAAMSGGFKKQKGEDNMLALMNDLRNLSLSDSKIEACADTIVSEYKDSTPVKGTQLVFCDLGIPKAASEKEDADDESPSKKVSEIANPDVYRKLIEKLVKKGIPREQIAFIQDYPKDKRQAVFEKVNDGEIRILIGSTTAMGAGTNCQKHLVALHDLDAPWRPRDLEQRHGRILRQGNENSEVSIYQYALKGSFDAVIWSKLKEKALLIELAMSSDMNSRSMEEADIITLEYSEMVGASLDDPLMKEKVDTENELSKVRNAQTEFSKKVQRAASTLETIDDKIETHQKAVEHIKKDIAGRKSTRGDNFSMTVGNKTFTKRDDAGKALEARLKDFDESKPTVVGSLGGFALKAVKTITGIEMEVVGKHAYPVKTISVQGLENTVNVQVDDTLEREEAYLEYLNQQKKDALDIHGQENPYAEKVKNLEEKLADLNRQIKERAMEESKKQNNTETGEAQEEKPSSKEATQTNYFTPYGDYGAQYNVEYSEYADVEKAIHEFAEKCGLERVMYTTQTTNKNPWYMFSTKRGAKQFMAGVDEVIAKARSEKPSSNRKYSLDNSDNLTYNESRALDKITDDMSFGEARELFLEERNRKLAAALNVFERAYNANKSVTDRVGQLFVPVLEARDDANQTRNEYTTEENVRNLERLLRDRGLLREGSYLAGDIRRVLNSLRTEGDNGSVANIPGEYERMYRKIEKYEKTGKFPSVERHSIRQGVFSNARSMDELKAEVKEAFPGARVQEQGNKLIFTMPNGQKVTFTFHESITVSDEELSRAKQEHGIDQRVTVTVEGYAESVGGEGFGALSQGSRKGTGFHEAYHIAEAIAFTKKELADAKRLISANEEERADAYAKWKLERKKGNNFAKLWQKIADVAAKMAGILGYETKRNIFRKVESGEIYRRDNGTARDVTRQYSVNASDNSTSSYKQRVKNFFMGKQDAPSHRRMLKNMMEEIADVKISYGKLDEGMEAIYKDAQKVIRVRNANDWEKVVPLFAKAVCDKIGIKADKALTHYISDWIQTGAPNNNSAEADTFAKAMREHPDVADQLLDLQSAFMRWNQMDAMERMQSIVSRRETEKTSISSMLDYAYDQIVEELGPVKRLVKQIEGKIGKQENALNPYVAFRLFRGHHGRAMTMLEGSGANMKAVLARHYPNLNWDGFKTLHEILDSIGGLHDEKIRDEFGNYALACHVYDIHLQNDQTEMQIDMLKKQLASTTDADKKKELQERIYRLDRSIMMTPISRTDCGKIIKEYGKKYGQAQQDLVHFSNMTLAILKDSGVISETRYARILRKWPNYVPMFRVFDENEKKNFGDSLKALEGSTRDVIDPLESIIRNTFDFVKKAEKNKAKCLLARLAQVSDVGKYIEPVDNNKPNDDTVITYYVDGQKRYLQTDPSVVAAVNGMGIDQSNLLMKILRFPARLARSAFTVTNPAFLIRNSTRDMQDAFIYNDRGTITPMDFVRAFMHAFRKDDIYWEWMSSGAAQASAISIDRDYAQATLDKMTKSWKQMFKDNPVTFPFKAFLDATERLAEFSELGTRIAAYERTKKVLAKDGAVLTNMDLAEAAYESRDLMDFARGGKASRQWNSLAIFANASIQGWDKFFRTFNVRKDPKAAMRAMARLAIGGMLPALLLTLANWDEDWWKEIPDWQKDSHWILAPNVRIPKGQDIGLRFVSSMIEKGLDAMHNNNPLTAKRALKPIYDQTPDILPTAMLPVIEAMTNYSFFKEAPIVPQYQKDLPAKLQYSGTTSGLAKALGDLLNYSPRKIDHLIQGYTGSVGKGATSAMDMARGEKRMNTAIEEMPVFSGFMMTPYKNSATVEKFYQEYRKQTEGDKAFKATKERMEGYSPAKYKRMSQANKKMSELNKKERKLLDDNRISPERKQELQAGIQRQRIAIAKRAMGLK